MSETGGTRLVPNCPWCKPLDLDAEMRVLLEEESE